jgi:hypothetical protein
MQGDSIEQLPVDNSQYNKELANVLFKEKDTINTVFNELKESLIIVILFIIFCSKNVDDLIIKFYPAAGTNPTTLILIKCVAVIFFFYVFKNFRLSRNS